MARTTTPSGERLATDGWYGDANYKLRSIVTGGWYDAAMIVPGIPEGYVGYRWQEEVVLAPEEPHIFIISESTIAMGEEYLARVRAESARDGIPSTTSSIINEDKMRLGEVERELAALKARTERKRHRTVIRRTIRE